MAKVYHAKMPSFDETVQDWPNDYEFVAEVASDDPNRVFELTNHIDTPWYENQGVIPFKRARSTSVGDIVEVRGKYHLCCGFGWKEVQVR